MNVCTLFQVDSLNPKKYTLYKTDEHIYRCRPDNITIWESAILLNLNLNKKKSENYL